LLSCLTLIAQLAYLLHKILHFHYTQSFVTTAGVPIIRSRIGGNINKDTPFAWTFRGGDGGELGVGEGDAANAFAL
jgi:hypothetical protein